MSSAAVSQSETIRLPDRLQWLENSYGLVELILSYDGGVEYGGSVQYVNANRYCIVSTFIHDLDVIQPGIRAEPNVIKVITKGIDTLQEFKRLDDPVRFQETFSAADDLLRILQGILETISAMLAPSAIYVPIFDAAISDRAAYARRHFESMFAKELKDLPLFCVEEKGTYDLRALIKGTSKRLPNTVTSKITPRISEEIDESGRCLAFSRFTASAFHSLRAVELLVLQWIDRLGIPKPTPNRCNWGEYISLLRGASVHKQATDLLQVIKDNYRNPIMHPEDTVDHDSAISLFAICNSAIEVICRHIP